MVLDILRLINDFIAEFFSLIERGVPAQCIIGSDQDIIPVISSDFSLLSSWLPAITAADSSGANL